MKCLAAGITPFLPLASPGIYFDNELCSRAWPRGLQAGYEFASFKGRPGQYKRGGGTAVFSPSARLSNRVRNEKSIISMYSQHASRVDQCVGAANIVSRDSTDDSDLSDGATG